MTSAARIQDFGVQVNSRHAYGHFRSRPKGVHYQCRIVVTLQMARHDCRRPLHMGA